MRITSISRAIVVLLASVVSGQPKAQPSLDQVFHFAHIETTQGFQEIATTIRALVDIRELFVDIAQKSLAVHGTADQIALVEWLFNQLDVPGSGQTPASQNPNSTDHQYRMSGSVEDVVRVFYLPPAETVQGLQEIITLLRTVADVRRIFGCTAQRAVPLRGTADQVALSEWLISQLETPRNGNSPAHEYRMPGSSDDLVRVFYLTHTDTARGVQEINKLIRTSANVHRVFFYSGSRAIALRGTVDQVVRAEQIIQEMDKPIVR
jgi:hypothetical protein